MVFSDDERRERIRTILKAFEERGLIAHPEQAFMVYPNGQVSTRETVAALIGFSFEDIFVLGGEEVLREIDGTAPDAAFHGQDALGISIAYFRRLIAAYQKLTGVQSFDG